MLMSYENASDRRFSRRQISYSSDRSGIETTYYLSVQMFDNFIQDEFFVADISMFCVHADPDNIPHFPVIWLWNVKLLQNLKK